MRRIVEITAQQILPTPEQVLSAQGVPDTATLSTEMSALVQEAIETYTNLAKPIGLTLDISRHEFESVFAVEKGKEKNTPLGNIFPSADHLTLFAVTIGDDICQEIAQRFDENDYARAAMLDAAASEGTELAADYVERQIRQQLKDQRLLDPSWASMQFSPGYCGWHLRTQKNLFEFLQPAEIGIELTDSCLMKPLKSVSGVVVIAKRNLFLFEDDFDFCRDCRTHSCRQRMQNLDHG